MVVQIVHAVISFGDDMKVTIFLLLFLPISCFGQELPSPCDVVMVDSVQASVLVASSNNGKFLVRLGSEGNMNKLQAFVFEWTDKSYVLRNHFVLNRGFPSRLMISDSGNLVSIGKKNAKTNIDEVNVYSKEKGLVKTIESIPQDYSGVSEGCMLRKPWVCWNYPISLVGENLNLLDLSGNEIDIDLASGQYSKSQSIDACEDYH